MTIACIALIDENCALLDQLGDMLASIPATVYREPPAIPGTGTLGAQTRHVLDHYEALFSADACVDYERRERGTTVERSRSIALEIILRLRSRLAHMKHHPESVPALKVCRESLTVSDGVDLGYLPTSIERELAFVASHTTHHMAIMRVQAVLKGVPVPESTGLAKATRNYIATQATAACRA